MRSKPDSLEAAFLAARYTVHTPRGDLVLRIGRPHAGLAALMASMDRHSLALVTAFNPSARPRDAKTNALDQRALRQAAEALGLPAWRAAIAPRTATGLSSPQWP